MERNRGPMNKNRIRGARNWGERARDREASVTKRTLRKSGGRTAKVSVLTWGDLALDLKGSHGKTVEREVSRGRSRSAERRAEGPNDGKGPRRDGRPRDLGVLR